MRKKLRESIARHRGPYVLRGDWGRPIPLHAAWASNEGGVFIRTGFSTPDGGKYAFRTYGRPVLRDGEIVFPDDRNPIVDRGEFLLARAGPESLPFIRMSHKHHKHTGEQMLRYAAGWHTLPTGEMIRFPHDNG